MPSPNIGLQIQAAEALTRARAGQACHRAKSLRKQEADLCDGQLPDIARTLRVVAENIEAHRAMARGEQLVPLSAVPALARQMAEEGTE